MQVLNQEKRRDKGPQILFNPCSVAVKGAALEVESTGSSVVIVWESKKDMRIALDFALRQLKEGPNDES